MPSTCKRTSKAASGREVETIRGRRIYEAVGRDNSSARSRNAFAFPADLCSACTPGRALNCATRRSFIGATAAWKKLLISNSK